MRYGLYGDCCASQTQPAVRFGPRPGQLAQRRNVPAAPVAEGAAPEDPIANAVRARLTWARLIYKVYEVDPLECPKCKGPMQVIALNDDPAVVRRILKHLNLWSPAKRFIPARGPPHVAPECAAGEPSNEHTYHPVPDIA